MTHKYNIITPHSVDISLKLYWITGTDLQSKVINKEMEKVKVDCKSHDEHTTKQLQMIKERDLSGCQNILCHIVFNVKIYFTSKS